MRAVITIITLFIFLSCTSSPEKPVYSPSKMYISDIKYFGEDSIVRKTYCIYLVSFKNATLMGESDFCFIDSIGKYKLDDKFPKKY